MTYITHYDDIFKAFKAPSPTMRSAAMADPTIYRVTMRLTENDVETTKLLERALDARSKADAISQALAIARAIVESMEQGKEVLIRQPGSDYAERLLLPKVRQAAIAS
jgi:hypothetical protein